MVDGRGLVMALILVIVCIFWRQTTALKCRTEDGPTSDEVRKVVRTCMKRISSESDNKTRTGSGSNEYENYDSSADDNDSGEQYKDNDEKRQDQGKQNETGLQQNSKNNRNNGGSRNRSRNSNDQSNSNRNRMDNGRNRDWDYAYDMGGRNNEGGRMSRGRYKRQYYNDGTQGGYGYNYQQNDRYNRDRNNFMNPVGNSSDNATKNEDRDRACLMQCFFQEMKMTNNEGFPDKHKVLHVVTKDLRDTELRDFYTDSIQECFHMISMDSKLKDKCDYTMKFVVCLADRGQANCNDWENETIMF